MNENFDFKLIGDEKAPWSGYNSAAEKTKLLPTYLIRGSYNVYKKRSGNIANRPGLKRIDEADETEAGTASSYTYRTDTGRSLPLRVTKETAAGGDAKLQVRIYDAWYELLESGTLVNPALALTRFSFDTWVDGDMSSALSEFKDRLIMVRGDGNILHWSGGITKIGTVETVLTGVNGFSVTNAGSGYVVGDEIILTGGNGEATVQVTDVNGSGAIQSGYLLLNRGSGYGVFTYSTTGGTGTGATVTVSSVTTYYNLNKQDTSTTWREDGFTNKQIVQTVSAGGHLFTKVIISGVEYTYVGGAETTKLHGFTVDITALVAGSVAIQPVYVETPTELSSDFQCDFIATVQNQVCVGSYTSRLIHISAADDADVPGFTNFLAISNALVLGDPDFVLLDDVANGMKARNGKLYVSSGISDWWEITPNFFPTTPIPFYHGLTGTTTAYIITKADKKAGTGRSGLFAHEFIDVIGDNIIYLGKDNQVRMIGSFSNIEGTQFPVISQEVFDELQDEDFTGGHLKAISDTIYITAPLAGRHWFYEIRSSVNSIGQISAERLWQPPQVAGISRFEDIEGVLHGYSNAHPVLYQIWNTGQWWDDAHTDGADGEPEQLPYNCLMRLAYRNHGHRGGLLIFDKIYFEGYVDTGCNLYGNLYYDYQGSRDVKPFDIHTDDSPAKLFLGSPMISIGGAPLGVDPLGTSLIPEADDQELLSKFKTICGFSMKEKAVSEYCLELLSNSAGSRWEIICLGANALPAKVNPVIWQKKSNPITL